MLKGNGADMAMHCVPPVTERRMSITLRRCCSPQTLVRLTLQNTKANACSTHRAVNLLSLPYLPSAVVIRSKCFLMAGLCGCVEVSH